MIFGALPPRIYIATKPVDFRKGLDGLAALVKEVLKLDPFCGAAFIFRAKSADRLKILIWDGSGLILIYKRLDDAKFRWQGSRTGSCACPRKHPPCSRVWTGFASGRFEDRVPRRCNKPDICLFLRAFSGKSWCCPAMIAALDDLPNDVGALKALVMHWAEQASAKDAESRASAAFCRSTAMPPTRTATNRPPSEPLILSFCWTHLRRRFYEIAVGGNAPLAEEALIQIAALYKIEEAIRGQSAEARCKVRQAKSRPLLEKFKSWLEKTLSLVPGSSKMAKAIRYAFHHWDGLILFANDGASKWTPTPSSVPSGPLLLIARRTLRRPRPGSRSLGHRRFIDRNL